MMSVAESLIAEAVSELPLVFDEEVDGEAGSASEEEDSSGRG